MSTNFYKKVHSFSMHKVVVFNFGELKSRKCFIISFSRDYVRKAQKTKKPLTRLFFLVAEMGFEPHDLRVMSPTSYQAALLRDILFRSLGAGDRDRTGTMLSHHGILSPGRLPVPPHRQVTPRDLRPFGSHCLL